MTTKSLRAMALALCGAFLAIACEKQPAEPTPTPDPEITLDNNSGEYTAEAGFDFISFTIDNPVKDTEPEAESNAAWVKIAEVRKAAVKFEYEKNTETSERAALITIKYGKAEPRTFSVKQAGAAIPDPVITLASTGGTYGPAAGSDEITYSIENPVDGVKAEVKSSQTWITVGEVGKNSFKFTYAANPDKDERTADLTVTYGKAAPKTYTVKQQGMIPAPVINLSRNKIELGGSTSMTTYVTFSIENPVQGKSASVASSVNWVKASIVESNGDLNVECIISMNESYESRTGIVTISYPGAENATITVEQGPSTAPRPEICFDEAWPVYIDGDAGYHTFSFHVNNRISGEMATATTNWPEWLSIISVTYTEVKYYVTKNSSGSSRQANVYINYKNAEEVGFVVYQYVAVEKPVIVVPSFVEEVGAASCKVTLTCSITNPKEGVYVIPDYDVPGWATCTGVDYNSVQFNLEANNGTSYRSFDVTWKYEGADDVKVTVSQMPLGDIGFHLGSETIIVDKLGTTVAVPYSFSYYPSDFNGFSVTSSDSWLHSSTNTIAETLNIWCDKNTTGAIRETSAVVKAYFAGGLYTTKNITVQQNYQDLTLTINPTSATKDFRAGEFTVNVVLADSYPGTVQCNSTPSWVRVKRSGSNSITFAYTQNNSRNSRSADLSITFPNHTPATFVLTQNGNPDFPDNVVDLGLESGLLWANANIGASVAYNPGNYYAWGETTVKSSYLWNNYAFGTETALTKYTGNSSTLSADDDVAAKTLGTGWRMPNSYDWIDIEDYCRITTDAQGGIGGLKITSKRNGNSIFIPFGGYKDGSTIKGTSDGCSYIWCKDRTGCADKNAWSFTGEGASAMPRYYGMPVRAVFDPSKL